MVLLIITIVLTAIMLLFILPLIIIANYIFNQQMVRTSKDKWKRGCSALDNEEQVKMYDLGLEWAKENETKKIEVDIYNEKLHLFGEYFDFGSKKCAIILQGRTESLWYSYYYAKPYQDLGYNILVVDSRAHGLSDGKYNCAGLKEYRDILAWTKYIKEKYNIEKFILHGICIGSATALYAITNDKDNYYEGIVADGMYTNFYETFKRHMLEDGHHIHPFIDVMMVIMRIRAGVDIKRKGPIKSLKNLTKPILFLYSKEDKFSIPEKAQLLYDITPGEKEIVWFEKGAHSHIRINNQERYDNSIKEFVKNHFNESL